MSYIDTRLYEVKPSTFPNRTTVMPSYVPSSYPSALSPPPGFFCMSVYLSPPSPSLLPPPSLPPQNVYALDPPAVARAKTLTPHPATQKRVSPVDKEFQNISDFGPLFLPYVLTDDLRLLLRLMHSVRSILTASMLSRCHCSRGFARQLKIRFAGSFDNIGAMQLQLE